MKRLLCIFMCFFSVVLFACFNQDPNSILTNYAQYVPTGGGAILGIYRPYWIDTIPWLDLQKGKELEPVAVIPASFPLTLNLTFTGFVDDSGTPDTDIVQISLYYYDKSAGWTSLVNITNPRHTVISDKPRAILGRHTVKTPLGYKKDEYIPLVFYAKSRNGVESFNLETFLELKSLRSAPNAVEGANVIALLITDNYVAY